ncbi:pantetheine-phosphate adenylyltransferase [Hyphomicrobiales bacterium]|nr:pantetheine-phosphate adenylyltransferase [Hyphomicrobiales bacterium]
MTLAVYPGSFDPFTLGHRDILLRSLKIFDEIVIAVGVNQNKKTLFSADERVEMIEKEVSKVKFDKNNSVKVECFEGLIVDLATKHNASSLIKGVRGPVDYDYEAQMAGMNTVMCPDLETIFLMSKPEFSFIHSSLVKQISLMGGDVTGFVSETIKNQLKTKS